MLPAAAPEVPLFTMPCICAAWCTSRWPLSPDQAHYLPGGLVAVVVVVVVMVVVVVLLLLLPGSCSSATRTLWSACA
jgi:hypothetical protein